MARAINAVLFASAAIPPICSLALCLKAGPFRVYRRDLGSLSSLDRAVIGDVHGVACLSALPVGGVCTSPALRETVSRSRRARHRRHLARDGRENSADSTRSSVLCHRRTARCTRSTNARDSLVRRARSTHRSADAGRDLLAACVVLGVLWTSRAGNLTAHLNSVLGTYASTTTGQHALPRDVGLSIGVELIGLAAGTGVLPVVAGLLWLAYAARGVLTRAWAEVAFARVVVVVGCVLFATTLYSQSFYLGPATEERYYFYVAPLLIVAGWRGVLGRLSRAQIAAGSVVMVACASILTLPRSLEDPEANFFAPGLATARSATELLEKGLTAALGSGCIGNPDLVAAVFALILGFTAVLRRLLPTGGGIAGLGLAAGLQFAVTATCVLSVAGTIPGVAGRTNGPSFARLGFVDRGAEGGDVTWLDNQPKVLGPPEDDVQRRTLLYNDRIERRASVTEIPTVPDNFPLSGLPIESVEVGKLTGRLRRIDLPVPIVDRLYVQTIESPLAQLDATRIRSAAAADRLELVMTSGRPRLRWAAQGLDGAGRLTRTSASLHAWGPHQTEMFYVEEKPGRLSVKWRGTMMRLNGGQDGVRRIRLPGCGSGAGTIATTGQIRLTRVAQRPC